MKFSKQTILEIIWGNMYSEILQMPGKFLDENFGNNFTINGFENFEKIYRYSEILWKFLKNFETEFSKINIHNLRNKTEA